MKKLAFIDHSFHIKSTATKFLIDILKDNFDTTVFWDDSWQTGVGLDLKAIRENGFDILVLFQMLNYDTQFIKHLGFEQVVIIPMYDGCYLYKDYEWKRFESFKFINFSSTLHNKLSGFGIESYHCQYVPDPEEFSQVSYGELNGFFWQRTDHINWYKVKKLASSTKFSKFHVHGAIDPGHKFSRPSAEDVKDYNISISEWFKKRADFQDVLHGSNVFFAPRLYEGIGMSFLEAMSKGMCVVAPHFPTMCEYIIHGKTGLLYDPYDPQPLDFSNAFEIGNNAREGIIRKRQEWLENIDGIPSFISAPFVYKKSKIKIPSKPLKEAFIEKLWHVYFHYIPKPLKPLLRKLYYKFELIRGQK